MSSPTSTQNACPSCGTGFIPGDRFCAVCGKSLGGSATASISPWDAVLRRLQAATLGEFEIKRELGRGGMAAVYLAHDIGLDLKVAIKVMAPGVMMGAGMIDRFRMEASTVAKLSHPNIVRVFALRQAAEDLYFIVMQYIPGRTIDRVVRETGPLPIPAVRAVLGQVARALAYAHKRGVVHRDIKPGNIMLDANGDAVVTDFGIAKVTSAPSQTLTGATIGTPAYMSPEQCLARPLTGASDQYSLGVVAFEIITGRTPFTGAAYTMMHGHTHGEVPAIRPLRPSCPPDLEAAVMRMLAKSPEDRFPTIADAAAEAGLPLLAESDPLRAELIRLAAAEDSATLDLLHPTPVSPVPPSRASISEPRPQDSPPAAAEPVQAAAEPVPAAADPAPPAAVAERAGGGSRMTVVWWASFAAVALVAGVLAITKPWVAVRSGDQNHEEAKSDTSVGPKPEPPKPERPLGVRIANAPATVTVGDTFTLAAVVSGGDSTTRPPNEWQSRTTAVLAIDPAGRARAIRQGTAMVLLRLGPAEDSVPIRVLPAEPPHTASRLVINAPAGPVRVADHVPLRVVSVDSAGVRRPPTTRVTWSSANQAIASVDAATGDVTAKSAGRVRISASSVDGRASIDIVVAPAPEPPQPPPPPPPERPRRDSVIVQPKASPDSARERVPPTKSPAVLKAELDDAVRAYAHAIEAKDMDQLRSLYTGMTQLQADGYSGFFNYARDIKVSIDRIDAAGALSATPGSEARVRVDYRFEFFNTSRRKPDHLSAQWDATMQRTASGWRILQIR